VQSNRRKFLKRLLTAAGLSAAAGAGWLGTSQHRSARWARHLAKDSGRKILPAPFKPRPHEWPDNAITLCWIGHATVLINFYGVRILTDPALGDRIGVSLGLGTVGPKRFIAPALTPDELPSVDVLLVSHAHMDHLDLPTLRRFAGKVQTVSAKDTDDLLRHARLSGAQELGWGEQTTLRCANGELQVEAIEVKHWGQRWPNEEPRGYNGYILRREGRTLLFAGDTAHTPLFAGLKSRGPFEAAIMPIGAYQPWIRSHCTPEQAVEMANAAGARFIVPMHHQTFKLSDEPMNEPIERLEATLQHEPERLAFKQVGESFTVPHA
jgi:L-ascorbate metabolism protein UlaG (beta-lactamase superfamily)